MAGIYIDRGLLSEALCDCGSGRCRGRSDAGGRVLDPGERRAMGCDADQDGWQSREALFKWRSCEERPPAACWATTNRGCGPDVGGRRTHSREHGQCQRGGCVPEENGSNWDTSGHLR